MQGGEPNAELDISIYTLAHICVATDDDVRPMSHVDVGMLAFYMTAITPP
jgi:hypothetical protein